MLDVVNEDLIRKGEDAIAFDSDCREGICGACGCMINGVAHGPDAGTTTCQLHMRRFVDGQTIVVEPWRAKAFPVLKDLTVDRSSFDRIIASGGYISAGVGGAQDANNILVSKERSDGAMDSAACIGCGACVAACKNAAAHLFTPKSRTLRFCRRESPSASRALCAWSSRWTPKDSGTAQRRRMRSRVPQTDPDFQYCEDGARVHASRVEGRASLGRARLLFLRDLFFLVVVFFFFFVVFFFTVARFRTCRRIASAPRSNAGSSSACSGVRGAPRVMASSTTPRTVHAVA